MTALCRQSKNKEENHFSHEIFVSQKQTGKNKEVSQGESEKGFKKVLAWGMSIVCMLAMVLAGSPMTAKASDSTSWNFKNTGFKNLGTISSTVTVDNLSLIATSSKTMSVIANSQTVDGTAYTYALALGGSGSDKLSCSQSTGIGNRHH